jgi:hypothetical protein
VYECAINRDVSIPAYRKPSVTQDPRHGPLDLPSAFVSPERSAVLVLSPSGGEMWRNELNATSGKPAPEGVGVVPAIRDEAVRILARAAWAFAAHLHRGESFRRELDLPWTRGM